MTASARPRTVVEIAADAANVFGFDLFAKLGSRNRSSIYSPLSIAVALTMTSAGARGETLAQMMAILHVRELADPHAGIAELGNALNGRDGRENVSFHIANRLWGQEGYPFRPPFLSVLRDRYHAPFGEVDFVGALETARSSINQWVASETRNRIKELIGPSDLDLEVRLVLTNTIYFKGQWRSRFDATATRDADFLTPNGKVSTKLMTQRGEFAYAHPAGAQIVEMPYLGGFSMVVVLPDAGVGTAELEGRLRAEYGGWLSMLTNTTIDISLPRWKASSKRKLKEPLAALGMPLAFDVNAADFSAMSKGRLYLGQVLHQAFAEVDEQGAEASAATAAIMYGLSFQEIPLVRADHPFLYFIRERETGAILFAGRMVDPRGEAEDP